MKVSTLVLVAASALATDSVEGQLVKGGRVEPRLLGKAGGRQLGARRQPVERSPNLVMCQHGLMDTPTRIVGDIVCTI
jgi:hypothetical protein